MGKIVVKSKYLPLVTLMPIMVVLDQVTKLIVLEKFRLYESIPVIEGIFNLTYVRNTGAAFGMMANADPAIRVPFFLLVPMLALGIIAYMFKKLPDRDLKMSITLSLIISGAVGNLIDRARLGYVVDFLDFHWKYQWHYPAFNVADMAICVGVGFMSVYMLFQKDSESDSVEFKKASKKGT